MRAQILAMAGVAALTLAIGPAAAGPCTVQIDKLSKAFAAKDAGSGPTSGATGSISTATTPGQHPPTNRMSQEASGKATSPEDVRRQTQGQPTAAQQGQGSTFDDRMARASAELDRAKAFDEQGKKTECTASLRQARRLSGLK